MDIGTAILIGSVANIFGMILFMYTRDLSWFKKENFKMQKSNVMAQNKIKLKKLEKDLGISTSRTPASSDKGLIESIQGLDLNKIRGLLDFVAKDEEEGPEEDTQADQARDSLRGRLWVWPDPAGPRRGRLKLSGHRCLKPRREYLPQ